MMMLREGKWREQGIFLNLSQPHYCLGDHLSNKWKLPCLTKCLPYLCCPFSFQMLGCRLPECFTSKAIPAFIPSPVCSEPIVPEGMKNIRGQTTSHLSLTCPPWSLALATFTHFSTLAPQHFGADASQPGAITTPVPLASSKEALNMVSSCFEDL